MEDFVDLNDTKFALFGVKNVNFNLKFIVSFANV